jgi:hypothetical protein
LNVALVKEAYLGVVLDVQEYCLKLSHVLNVDSLGTHRIEAGNDFILYLEKGLKFVSFKE